MPAEWWPGSPDPGRKPQPERSQVANWLHAEAYPQHAPCDWTKTPRLFKAARYRSGKRFPPPQVPTLRTCATLRQLHALNPPGFLQPIDPFARVHERIERASHLLTNKDQEWLSTRLLGLRKRWDSLPESTGKTVLHGDAHNGNTVVPQGYPPTIIDLERFAIGPRAWDLTLTAVEYVTCSWVPHEDYAGFCETYEGSRGITILISCGNPRTAHDSLCASTRRDSDVSHQAMSDWAASRANAGADPGLNGYHFNSPRLCSPTLSLSLPPPSPTCLRPPLLASRHAL